MRKSETSILASLPASTSHSRQYSLIVPKRLCARSALDLMRPGNICETEMICSGATLLLPLLQDTSSVRCRPSIRHIFGDIWHFIAPSPRRRLLQLLTFILELPSHVCVPALLPAETVDITRLLTLSGLLIGDY